MHFQAILHYSTIYSDFHIFFTFIPIISTYYVHTMLCYVIINTLCEYIKLLIQNNLIFYVVCSPTYKAVVVCSPTHGCCAFPHTRKAVFTGTAVIVCYHTYTQLLCSLTYTAVNVCSHTYTQLLLCVFFL